METGRYESKFGYELETYKWKPEKFPKVRYFYISAFITFIFSSYFTSATDTASGREITALPASSSQSSSLSAQLFSGNSFIDERLIKLNSSSHDHYGHGKSGPFEKTHRDRCQIKNFDETAADLSARIKITKTEYSELPFILYGHSMGGLISSLAIMNDKPDLDGVILSAPALKVKLLPRQSIILIHKIYAELNEIIAGR